MVIATITEEMPGIRENVASVPGIASVMVGVRVQQTGCCGESALAAPIRGVPSRLLGMPTSTSISLAPAWLSYPADVNALDPRIWPNGTARTTEGALTLGGIPATKIADDFGTPLYVIDKATALAEANALASAFREALGPHGANLTLYYAGKALLTGAVVRWMIDAGYNVDVATGGEMAIALAAGAPAERLGLHGNNKSDAEIAAAIRAGVGTIVLDSAEEVLRVAAAARAQGVRQRVRLRVKPGVDAHTHEYISTALPDQKFGVAMDAVHDIVAAIRAQDSLEFRGLHSHIGSQIFSPEAHCEAVRRLLGLHATLLADGPVPELNIGGGYGIAYVATDDPTPFGEFAATIVEVIVSECARYRIPVPDIAIEAGRAIIGRAGVTLYTVGVIKDVQVDEETGASRQYVAVDGGMSDNVRPALYGADYTPALASRRSGSDPVLSRVVGKHCETGDIVVRDAYLPDDISRGDILAVADTGAYTYSLSSNYNMLLRPAIVAVDGGKATAIVRRERISDIMSRDLGLND